MMAPHDAGQDVLAPAPFPLLELPTEIVVLIIEWYAELAEIDEYGDFVSSNDDSESELSTEEKLQGEQACEWSLETNESSLDDPLDKDYEPPDIDEDDMLLEEFIPTDTAGKVQGLNAVESEQRRNSLRHLMVVCKELHALVLRVLWRELEFNLSPNPGKYNKPASRQQPDYKMPASFENWHATLSRHLARGSRIHRFSLFGREPISLSLPPLPWFCFVNLRHLHLENESVSYALKQIPLCPDLFPCLESCAIEGLACVSTLAPFFRDRDWRLDADTTEIILRAMLILWIQPALKYFYLGESEVTAPDLKHISLVQNVVDGLHKKRQPVQMLLVLASTVDPLFHDALFRLRQVHTKINRPDLVVGNAKSHN